MFLLGATGSGTPADVGAADLVFSATDLVTASECGYRLLRVLDEKLGRAEKPVFPVDEMMQRAASLGDVHERRVLEELISVHGEWSPDNPAGVYDVAPAGSMDRATLTAKHEESLKALRSGASVVFQAAFFDGSFHGRSDFLVRQPDGSYAVWDTKLARHAKVGALLQLTAYGDQLLRAGIPTSPEVTLVLGDRSNSLHSLTDLLPVFRERRSRFLDLVGRHREQPGRADWNDPGAAACGRCDYCWEQVEDTRDLLLVAAMTGERRARLRSEGILTIDQLASARSRPADGAFERLREQARLQVGTADVDGSITHRAADGAERTLSYRLLADNTVSSLPAPNEGDIFFDFEGDPLWQDPMDGSWGLEYLFGVVEQPSREGSQPTFRPFWAHGRAEERTAFTQFLDYVAERRQQYPDLHVYHYAAYERSALRRLSLVHVIGEDAVDTLLRDGVLVDLYTTVRHSLRISERSYSLKKLEPLYMGGDLRSGDVTDAGASVVAYAEYCAARDAGEDALAATVLAGISDYNRYDCVSTLGLRDWLLRIAVRPDGADAPGSRSGGDSTPMSVDATGSDTGIGLKLGLGLGLEIDIGPRTAAADEEAPAYGPGPEETRLLEHLAALPTDQARHPDQRAVALIAAAVGYHRRERKQFWWAHYDRLAASPHDWEESRDVVVLATCEVLEDWAKPTPRSNAVRLLRATARAHSGSDVQAGHTYFAIYDAPAPPGTDDADISGVGRGGWFGVEVVELREDQGTLELVIREKVRKNGELRAELPVALAEDRPIATTSLEKALVALAGRTGEALPEVPDSLVLDLLHRTPPRLSDGAPLPPVPSGPDGYAEAITAALQRLDGSYLAVQGPPGTGKTHVGADVVRRLVALGWKVGVVAQSHAVVDNLLCRALEAGVPEDAVAKKPKSTRENPPWSRRTDDDIAQLLAGQDGCLVGGTAWTMTGSKVTAGSLDLLVIDEAGQFSLANTMAVAQSARRLLLLGDPQQLPQVSQGSHPEPVDHSALGWLSDGHATLPTELGYFLADTWRMHPELCSAVSTFAYADRLQTAPAAEDRQLRDVRPGIELVEVQHAGNATSSAEEASEVVRQVKRHLGLAWRPDRYAGYRLLGEEDILVVAPYNAQVQLIQRTLAAAGLGRVRVGTVDRFQGQQAVVVIVSMSASSAAEAPRGIGFLLNRNRVNVAVSRGQWRAVIIRSPRLTHHMPSQPAALAELGAFIGLCEKGR